MNDAQGLSLAGDTPASPRIPAPKSRGMRVLWNSISATLMFIISFLSTLVISPVIVRSFGAERYGLWELMASLTGYLSLLDLGISPAIVRYVAVAKGANDPAQLQRVFSAGLVFFLSLAALGAIVLGLAAIEPSTLLNAKVSASHELRLTLVMFSMTFACNYACAAPVCYLLGVQAYTLVNAFRMIKTVAQTAIMYWFLVTGTSSPLVTMAAVVLGAALIETAFFMAVLRTHESAPSLSLKVSRPLLRELSAFGVKSAALTAAVTLMRSGALFMLAHFASVAHVVFFVFPLRLIEYSQSLGQAMGTPLTPYFADAFGRGGRISPTGAWITSTRALQFVVFGTSLGTLWLGLPFLDRWIGSEYVDRGTSAFWILCAGMLVQSIAINAGRLVLSIGFPGALAASALVLGAICLASAIPLVSLLGITGAAIATAAFWLGQSSVELWLACRHLGISPIRHVSDTLRRYGVPLLAGSLAFYFYRRLSYPTGYAQIALHAVVGETTYLIACVVTAISGGERRALWIALKSRVESSRARWPRPGQMRL